ncbi:MAG: LamG domain-containing protein [Myxococcota bacterium]
MRWALWALLIAGCAGDPETLAQTFVEVEAEPAVRAVSNRLRVQVCTASGTVYDEALTLGSEVSFPVTIPFTPAGGDTTRQFGWVIETYDSEGRRRTVLQGAGDYDEGLGETTVVSLADGCLDQIHCPSGQQCSVVGGLPTCVDAAVPVACPRELAACEVCREGSCSPVSRARCSGGICANGRCLDPRSYWPLDADTEGMVLDRVGATDLERFGDSEIVLDPERGRTLRLSGDAVGAGAAAHPNGVSDRVFTYAFWFRADPRPPATTVEWLFAESAAASGGRSLNGIVLGESREIRAEVRLDVDKTEMIATPIDGFDILEWHHYALTADGSRWRLFVDGVEVSSSNVATPASLSAFEATGLGILNRQPRESGAVGRFDDVFVFGRPLSAEDVCALAHPRCS